MMTRDFWDERFGASDYAYGTEPNNFLVNAVRHIPAKGRVLCIAEGEGRNGVFLAKNGFTVSAVDISPEGKKKALALAADNNVSIDYVTSDVGHFDFGENEWDAVISIFGFIAHDARARKLAFERIQAALKQDGVLIMEAYHPRQLAYKTGGPKEVELLITLDELNEAFENEQILHKTELEREVVEGIYHTGKACVTQFIYKKTS
ncbi:MAG: methyltransferase domain-containing protein [Emcibacter sp.]|nr:methyltransferase domain-containing protein [Emcibacter sp.]